MSTVMHNMNNHNKRKTISFSNDKIYSFNKKNKKFVSDHLNVNKINIKNYNFNHKNNKIEKLIQINKINNKKLIHKKMRIQNNGYNIRYSLDKYRLKNITNITNNTKRTKGKSNSFSININKKIKFNQRFKKLNNKNKNLKNKQEIGTSHKNKLNFLKEDGIQKKSKKISSKKKLSKTEKFFLHKLLKKKFQKKPFKYFKKLNSDKKKSHFSYNKQYLTNTISYSVSSSSLSIENYQKPFKFLKCNHNYQLNNFNEIESFKNKLNLLEKIKKRHTLLMKKTPKNKNDLKQNILPNIKKPFKKKASCNYVFTPTKTLNNKVKINIFNEINMNILTSKNLQRKVNSKT